MFATTTKTTTKTISLQQAFNQLNQYATYGIITEARLREARINLIAHILLSQIDDDATLRELEVAFASVLWIADLFVYDNNELCHEIVSAKQAYVELERYVVDVVNLVVQGGGVFDVWHTDVSKDTGYAVAKVVAELAEIEDTGVGEAGGWSFGRVSEVVGGVGAEAVEQAVGEVMVRADKGVIIPEVVEVADEVETPKSAKQILLEKFVSEKVADVGTVKVQVGEFKFSFLKWVQNQYGLSFTDFEIRNLPVPKGYWK